MSQWRNSGDRYGRVSIALHWLTALVVAGMFGFGLWMTELEYYDAWYQRAPALHKSVGVLLFLTVLARWAWRRINPPVLPVPGVSATQARLAAWSHRLLYLLLFATMFAGYLISTADGRPVPVFGLFDVPATITGKNQEDIAGVVHLSLAISLISLSSLHALAALKHHFIDRDRTLLRMLDR
jgi:cytochrome b561